MMKTGKHVWICTGNKLAKFQGNILSLSENIAKSFLGGRLLFLTHTVDTCNKSNRSTTTWRRRGGVELIR